ncbi:MAG TPA: acyl-CoA dehydrogenase [Candidatus Eisenbacteria bacterium]|nr:acyl-CoA dehydrogenase [Candidatus Eisenbacteria bacterium]
MALVRTEEQEILARTAREFVTSRSPLRRVRELREDPVGFSRELWTAMAELGWLGIVVPEQYGGAGLGWAELAVVMEEVGRGLMPEPLVGTVLLGATALLLGGSEAQKQAHLPPLVGGERLFAVGYQEAGSRYDVARVATRAERAGGGWKLTGEKIQVLDGQVADWLVISARSAGEATDASGVTLFLVPKGAPGLRVERQWRVDSRPAAGVRLEGVAVGADAVLGGEGQGAALLGRVLDRATIGLAADMLGGMSATFEMTLDYLKTRKQFGVPIGSFQALKHRAARMFIETELARSVVMAAAQAADAAGGDAQVARLASVAKARAADAYNLIAAEGVQMHGGIGMTDEHDVGLYFKRARGSDIQFGDATFHRDRVAHLDGY